MLWVDVGSMLGRCQQCPTVYGEKPCTIHHDHQAPSGALRGLKPRSGLWGPQGDVATWASGVHGVFDQSDSADRTSTSTEFSGSAELTFSSGGLTAGYDPSIVHRDDTVVRQLTPVQTATSDLHPPCRPNKMVSLTCFHLGAAR